MAAEKFTLKDFIEKRRPNPPKETKPKKRKGGLADSWFTSDTSAGDSGGTSSGLGESLILELLAGIIPGTFSANVLSTAQLGKNRNDKDAGMTTYPSAEPAEEEAEAQTSKVDVARRLFQAMIDHPNASRADIINRFMKEVGVTNSTAVSYYTRFMKESGRSADDEAPENLGQGPGMGRDEEVASQPLGQETMPPPAEPDVEMENPIDPDRAGIIRTVKNAHLVYKRQAEDGTYDELWVYNIHDSTHDDLDIRRDILAGTDIPVKKTKSPDGKQSYSINTMGNAQMLSISGLPN
jgi:hypothetical protein